MATSQPYLSARTAATVPEGMAVSIRSISVSRVGRNSASAMAFASQQNDGKNQAYYDGHGLYEAGVSG